MKERGRLFMWAGIVLSILTFFLVQNAAQPDEPEIIYPELRVLVVEEGLTEPADRTETEEETIGILPARTPMKKALTTENAMDFRFVRSDYVPPGAIVVTGTVSSPADLVPRWGKYITLVDLQSGNLVTRQVLAEFKGLQSGMRTVSLPVNEVTSVGGTIRTGDHVDVVVSYTKNDEDGIEVPVTEMFLQDVLVISAPSKQRFFLFEDVGTKVTELVSRGTSQEFGPEGGAMTEKVVTLALPPEDALRLTYMSNFAKEVRLLVRPPGDTGTPDVEPVIIEELQP